MHSKCHANPTHFLPIIVKDTIILRGYTSHCRFPRSKTRLVGGSHSNCGTNTKIKVGDISALMQAAAVMAMLSQQVSFDAIPTIHPHDLAKYLRDESHYIVVDCRPVLAYNSCHISGAVNVNFTGMMRKRLMAGKIGLTDLVTTEAGKEKFKSCLDWQMVVYDECTTDLKGLPSSNSVLLVIHELEKMGKCPYLLQGGLNEFGVLHPSLCEVSVPMIRKTVSIPRMTTPGQREQPLDWKTAPPVCVLSYLVLGSEQDAKSREVIQDFKIKYVLNVTPKCPNHFENENIIYKRISVTDTGSQKLSNHFMEAFEFIEQARNNNTCVLIHCMAGISRSVTLTIAYLMYYFRMSMQSAYQFVKEKRPAISPNLNFMGQLVEFERELELNPHEGAMSIDDCLPLPEQERLSERMKGNTSGSSSSAETTPEATKMQEPAAALPLPFVLKLPVPRGKKCKNKKLASPNLPVGTERDSSSSELQPPGKRHSKSSKGYISDAAEKSPILHDLEQEHKVESTIKTFEQLACKNRDAL